MADIESFAITPFVAIFAIVNPINATTFFVVLTRTYPKDLKRRVMPKEILAATLALLLFAFLGNSIFALFGTSIPRSASPAASSYSRSRFR